MADKKFVGTTLLATFSIFSLILLCILIVQSDIMNSILVATGFLFFTILFAASRLEDIIIENTPRWYRNND